MLCVFEPFFHAISDERNLWLLLKSKYSVFSFFEEELTFDVLRLLPSSCLFELTNMENFIATACWWPCCYLKCASSLRIQERTWVFLKAFKFLRWCSTFVQNKTMEIGYTPPDFHCAYQYSWISQYWTVFFACRSGFKLKFPSDALILKRFQLGSKTDSCTNGLNLEFLLVDCSSFRRHQVCMDWSS